MANREIMKNGMNTNLLSILIRNLPIVNIVGSYGPYFKTDDQIEITGSPTGGTLSGPGVTGGTMYFTPGVANYGNHTIRYDYTDEYSLSNSATTLISVIEAVLSSTTVITASQVDPVISASLIGSTFGMMASESMYWSFNFGTTSLSLQEGPSAISAPMGGTSATINLTGYATAGIITIYAFNYALMNQGITSILTLEIV